MDHRGIEPRPPRCKRGVLPLSLAAQLMLWRSQGVTIPFFWRDKPTCVHEHFETLFFGSPSWARTTDIRINSPTQLPTVLTGNKFFWGEAGNRTLPNCFTDSRATTTLATPLFGRRYRIRTYACRNQNPMP